MRSSSRTGGARLLTLTVIGLTGFSLPLTLGQGCPSGGTSDIGSIPGPSQHTDSPTADLAVSSFTLGPSTIAPGAHPTQAQFHLCNQGPWPLSSPNTRVFAEFYLSTNTTFGDSDDVRIGDNGYDLEIADGSCLSIELSATGLSYITVPADTPSGSYYAFVKVRHDTPSILTDANTEGNCTMSAAAISVVPGGTIPTPTCPTGQFATEDGVCRNCSSTSCSAGLYLGDDGVCHPSPASCFAGPVSLAGVDSGPEGLSEQQADALGADSSDLPAELSDVAFVGGDAGTSTTAATKGARLQAPADDCIRNSIWYIRTFHRDMLAKAIELGRRTPIEDDDEGPAQPNGLAYVYGGKDPTQRLAPHWKSVCQQHLFGLDCSGFVRLCANAGGVPLTADYSTAQGLAESWPIPSEWKATMVFIQGTPANYQTGDIAVFSGHIGIIVVTKSHEVEVWNSAGSYQYSCAKNMDRKRGPTRWPASKLGIEHYPALLGVLRLIPNCAVQDVLKAEDTVESVAAGMQQLLDESNQDKAYIDSVGASCLGQPAACLLPAVDAFENRYCKRLNEVYCLCFRLGFLTTDEITRQLTDLLVAMVNVSFNIPMLDGRTCACQSGQ